MCRSFSPNGFRVLTLIALLVLAACGEDATGPEDTPEELIAFTGVPVGGTASEALEIFVVRPDGTDLRQLTDGLQAFGPAWSPDGSMIAFTSLDPADPNVFVMNADGSDQRRLTTGSDRSKLHVSWHPDGEELVYVDGTAESELHAVAVEGGEPRLIHACPAGCQWPAWSPDGSELVMVTWPPREGTVVRDPTIAFLNIATGELAPLYEELDYGHQPSWSRDGTLAFVEIGAVVLASADGTVLETLPSAHHVTWVSPSFSPDGSRIVVQQANRSDDTSAIIAMDRDGSAVQTIVEFPTRHTFYFRPVWRP